MSDRGEPTYQAALDTIDSALIAISATGCVLFVNRAGDKILRDGEWLKLANGILTAGTAIATHTLLSTVLRRACEGVGTRLLLNHSRTGAEVVLSVAPAPPNRAPDERAGALVWLTTTVVVPEVGHDGRLALETGAEVGVRAQARIHELHSNSPRWRKPVIQSFINDSHAAATQDGPEQDARDHNIGTRGAIRRRYYSEFGFIAAHLKSQVSVASILSCRLSCCLQLYCDRQVAQSREIVRSIMTSVFESDNPATIIPSPSGRQPAPSTSYLFSSRSGPTTTARAGRSQAQRKAKLTPTPHPATIPRRVGTAVDLESSLVYAKATGFPVRRRNQ